MADMRLDPDDLELCIRVDTERIAGMRSVRNELALCSTPEELASKLAVVDRRIDAAQQRVADARRELRALPAESKLQGEPGDPDSDGVDSREAADLMKRAAFVLDTIASWDNLGEPLAEAYDRVIGGERYADLIAELRAAADGVKDSNP